MQNQAIRIIMPDLRYYKDGQILLGEQQWLWFENILQTTNDDLYLIVSGIQVLSSNRLVNLEHWPRTESARLFKLLEIYQKAFLIISGDVHHAQFLQSDCNPFGSPIIELTSSGITHTCDKNILGFCKEALNILTPRYYLNSPPVIDYNYLKLEIS